jgi:cellulose 1,4-beta-cellobiosidase
MTLPRFAAAVLGVAALITAAPAAHANPPPVVSYTLVTNWGSGFQAQIAITPAAAVTSWSLEFDAADQQSLFNAFYAASSQSGRHVTLTNRVFNGSIAAGSTLILGVQLTNPALVNAPPPSFTFNGQPATYTPQPYIQLATAKPSVPEGGSAPLAVTLSQPPAANLILQLSQGSAAVVVGTPASLTFTPTNWNVPQNLTLSSPRDTDTTNQTAWLSLASNQWGGIPFASAWFLASQLDNG